MCLTQHSTFLTKDSSELNITSQKYISAVLTTFIKRLYYSTFYDTLSIYNNL